jgi:hypothetical protein
VSDRPKIDTRTWFESGTRSICTKSIDVLNCNATLARSACVAFATLAALAFAGTPASAPVADTARGTIGSHNPETMVYTVTHQQSDERTAAADDDMRA